MVGFAFAKPQAPQIQKPYSDKQIDQIITQAQDTLLEGKRGEAVKILESTLNEEKTQNAGVKSRLVAAVNQIANTFLLDQAQQNYELGVSFFKSNPDMARKQFALALSEEPENARIMFEIAALEMGFGDCTKMIAAVEKYPISLVHIRDLGGLYASGLVCAGRHDEFRRFFQKVSPTPTDLFWVALRAESAFVSGEYKRAKEIINSVGSKTSEYSPLFYWKWQIEGSKIAKQKFQLECVNVSDKRTIENIYLKRLCLIHQEKDKDDKSENEKNGKEKLKSSRIKSEEEKKKSF